MYPDRLFGTGFFVRRNGIPFASAQTGTWRRACGGRRERGRGRARILVDAGSASAGVPDDRMGLALVATVLLVGDLVGRRGALRSFAGIRDMRCCRLRVPVASSVAVLLSILRACVKPAH